MIKNGLAVLGILLLGMSSMMHELHLSNSHVNYDEKSMSVQVTMHIFIDDLELALKNDGITGLKIGTEKESPDADDAVADYIDQHFNLIVAGDTLQQGFLGKEVSEDLMALWCYIELPIDQMPQDLEVVNTILTREYDDQKNIVVFKKNKKRITDFLLDVKDISATVEY